MSKHVEFFYSPASRYSYLALSQISSLIADTGCTVGWRPVHGPDVRALRGADPFLGKPVSGQYDPAYRETDARAWADLYGIPFEEPREFHFDYRLLVRGCASAGRLGALADFSLAVAKAVWGEGRWPVDAGLCRDIAAACGIDPDEFSALLDSESVEAEIVSTAHDAFERGVFGVPSFIVEGSLFWGNDRLPVLRHALR
jgi:2-hydroxychromene-2-carboxylate isomerase